MAKNYSDPEWIGKKFGSLTVIEPIAHYEKKRGYRCWYWKCQCDCGKEVVRIPYQVINAKWASCGCSKIHKNEKYSNPNWIGQKFNRLTVIGIVRDRDVSSRSRIRWKLRCDCGKEIVTTPFLVASGDQKSCGCLSAELARNRMTKHGESHTRLFNIWANMRDRCNNAKNKRYDRYGGRGISVCKEWENDYISFANWARENGYKDDLTIDRIDVNGNYEPSNCRWANMKTQQRNRSNNHMVTIDGETKALAEWCEIYGNNLPLVSNRISNMGWDEETAIKTPSGGVGANQTTFHPELKRKVVEPKYHAEKRYVEIDGEKMTLKAACEMLGMPYKAVHLRITRRGWPVERALSEPIHENADSLKSKCEKSGLGYATVCYRIRKLGWDEEKALTTPLQRKKKK